MNLLLDTHVLLWALGEPDRIAEAARDEIVSAANAVYVSVATAWEIAIKVGLGKLAVAPDVKDWLPDRLSAARFTPLSVSLQHAVGVEHLPLHHRDPFDRLLIAQAVTESMTIVTRDRIFERYAVGLMPC